MFGALCKAILLALPLLILFLWIPAFAGMTDVVYASEQYFFSDEFNEERPVNTLDINKWTVSPNAAAGVTTIQETGGNFVTTQNNFTNQYPFVISKNPALPEGDFEAEIRFQYTHVTPFGSGFAMSQTSPVVPGNDFGGLLALSVWQDNNIGLQMRLQYQSSVVYSITINTNPHIFKVVRTGLKYKLYLDGNLVYTSPDNPVQVRFLWFGNPTLQSGIPDWTKFNIDYVRIKEVKTPLILIPGIGGSEFKVALDTFWSEEDGHGGIFNRAYSFGEKVWVNEGEAANPGEDDYFDILRLKPDGITPEANLELTGELFGGAYQPTIDFFTSNGYELNNTLFIFPYDWRKDISLTAPMLDQRINEIKTQTGSEKVDIVAHSMGGLVARNYITDSNRAQNIRKLITLGTPHLGSVDYLKKLIYGDCLTKSIILSKPICIGIASSEIKDVLRNMLGGFQLVPSLTYFNFYTGEDYTRPFPILDNRDIDNNGETEQLNYTQTKELLTNLGHNTNLFTPSELFHNLDNNLGNTNGVEVTIIAGSGIPTLGQIIERNTFDLGGIKLTKKDEISVNGDNTVPLFSASLIDADNNISLLGTAKIFYVKQEHSQLVTDNPALHLIKHILNNENDLPARVSIQPYRLTGRQLSVHSPVNIHVYDSNGNHTGPTPDGDFEVNIPGSLYDTLDSAKFIWLPEDGIYNISFEATNQGSFDFKIRNFDNDINTQTILYSDIPVEEDSEGQTVFDTTSEQPSVLQVDSTSYSHFSILNGAANYDHDSPEVLFDVNPKTIWPPNNKMIDVNITGKISDENPYLITVAVDDEYTSVEPTLTSYNQTDYSQTIKLEAFRKGGDKDGRKYKINVLVKDLAGNTAQQQLEIIVPHDQR